MPLVKFTYALKKFFPGLKDTRTDGKTLTEVLQQMDGFYPGVRGYVLDDQGSLRKHVNIFIDGTMIDDRVALTDSFKPESEIYIIQALSGG